MKIANSSDATDLEPRSFPPAPWKLGGDGVVSVWWNGRALWATAFVSYDTRGVLAYNELLVARVIRWARRKWHWRPVVTIAPIWVDNEISRRGGRDLWDIPKEQATIDIQATPDAFTACAKTVNGRELARCSYSRRWALPITPTLSLETHQQRLVMPNGPTNIAHAKVKGSIEIGRGVWMIASPGPLDFLHGARPRITVRSQCFDMLFGN